MAISGGKTEDRRRGRCVPRLRFRSSFKKYGRPPTERARGSFHDGSMILQKWLEELRGALSEQDVVEFARSKLERARAGVLTPEIAASPLATGNDVRELAARLAAVPASASNDLLQQLLIVFSLATDRLSDLERRGMVVRAPRGVTTAG